MSTPYYSSRPPSAHFVIQILDILLELFTPTELCIELLYIYIYKGIAFDPHNWRHCPGAQPGSATLVVRWLRKGTRHASGAGVMLAFFSHPKKREKTTHPISNPYLL